jgi:hypothetical protein
LRYRGAWNSSGLLNRLFTIWYMVFHRMESRRFFLARRSFSWRAKAQSPRFLPAIPAAFTVTARLNSISAAREILGVLRQRRWEGFSLRCQPRLQPSVQRPGAPASVRTDALHFPSAWERFWPFRRNLTLHATFSARERHRKSVGPKLRRAEKSGLRRRLWGKSSGQGHAEPRRRCLATRRMSVRKAKRKGAPRFWRSFG